MLVADVPLLFIAGGTGIAPMRSMILEALHGGQQGDPRAGLLGAHARTSSPTWTSCAGSPTDGQLALTLTLTGEAEDWAHARGRDRRRAPLGSRDAAHAGLHLRPAGDGRPTCPPALVALGLPRERMRTEDW